MEPRLEYFRTSDSSRLSSPVLNPREGIAPGVKHVSENTSWAYTAAQAFTQTHLKDEVCLGCLETVFQHVRSFPFHVFISGKCSPSHVLTQFDRINAHLQPSSVAFYRPYRNVFLIFRQIARVLFPKPHPQLRGCLFQESVA